ncbi:MAG: DUF58 domain-containing protein [Ignavibacteriaceae bacterium]|nr:DUF58 domain-containing protein [Ignavibacteriaceae bacterium]HRI47136.1 DUF58 domain-containing protein [Ignavibacteriaceae bacterium]
MSSSKEDYLKYLNPSTVSKLSSFELKAKMIVEGFLLGLHKSPYHGFSIEFSQHRPYMQGDAIKDIDWKVYGKSDKFYVKQYEEETNLKCHILVDVSKSMGYKSTGQISKLEYASLLAASLSYLMLKQKDAVGLTLYSNKIIKTLPPKASNNYLKELLITLNNVEPLDTTNTSDALNTYAENIKRKGIVIVISDFFDEPEKVYSALKHFAFRKHEIIVFQILDPLESNFAFDRDSIFIDLETNEEMTTQPHQIQKAYQEAMKSFLSRLKNECLNNSIEYNLIDTSMNFDKALISYLQKRSRIY